jgi:hypothetical protein
MAKIAMGCYTDVENKAEVGAASLAAGVRRGTENLGAYALDLQPAYGLASWWLVVAYYGQRRYAEGVQMLEQVVALSRAPIFVGLLGLGYGYAGRVEDARSLLRELEDRVSRGEHPDLGTARHPGRTRRHPGDTSRIARGGHPPCGAIHCAGDPGCFLRETLRTDPEIDRAHRRLFGW